MVSSSWANVPTKRISVPKANIVTVILSEPIAFMANQHHFAMSIVTAGDAVPVIVLLLKVPVATLITPSAMS